MSDEIRDFLSRSRISVCCDSPMIRDTDICSDCKDHTQEQCECCDGTGEIIARHRINCRTIDIPYQKCPECGGTGIQE